MTRNQLFEKARRNDLDVFETWTRGKREYNLSLPDLPPDFGLIATVSSLERFSKVIRNQLEDRHSCRPPLNRMEYHLLKCKLRERGVEITTPHPGFFKLTKSRRLIGTFRYYRDIISIMNLREITNLDTGSDNFTLIETRSFDYIGMRTPGITSHRRTDQIEEEFFNRGPNA